MKNLDADDLLHRVIARIKVCADEVQRRRRGEDFLVEGQFCSAKCARRVVLARG